MQVLLLCLALAQPSDAALRGLDPVALSGGREAPGREDLELSYGGYSYRFETPDSRERFLEQPQRWAIQWGGACGRMGPLSGLGDAQRFAVHGGRIFLFASDGCRDHFLSAPEPFVETPPRAPQPSDAERAEGARLVARAARAHGLGDEGLTGVLRFELTALQQGWTTRRQLVCDGRGRSERRVHYTPPADATDEEVLESRWVVGDDSFKVWAGEVTDMGSAARADALRQTLREPLALLALASRDDFIALPVEGAQARAVVVYVAGLTSTLQLDAETGRVLALSWRGRLNDGAARDVREVLDDFREVDGLLVPFAREVTLDGRRSDSSSVTWESVERLEAAPAGSFERR